MMDYLFMFSFIKYIDSNYIVVIQCIFDGRKKIEIQNVQQREKKQKDTKKQKIIYI